MRLVSVLRYQVRHAAGANFASRVPAAAAAFALVLPLALHIQVIDPVVGGVPSTRLTPAVTVPSTGVRVRLWPESIAFTYVIVIAPVAALIAMLATLLVAPGAVHPLANADPLAAFSATETLAESARARPSVTFARTK